MSPRKGAKTAAGRSDLSALRREFPVLDQRVHGKPLVYLDSAASCQKPESVLAAVDRFYRRDYSNIHRGLHALSERATKLFEDAREKVRTFLNAADAHEIVFVRGATEGINLVARSWGGRHLRAGDEVLVTGMEHHANIVPWQMICAEKGAKLRVIPITDRGELEIERLPELITERTRLVSVVQVSNALGTVNDVRRIIDLAHARGVPVLLDAAQAVPHQRVDVRELGCDFLVFSGHKMYAPTGSGVLYGRQIILEAMPPYQGGGEMIESVTFEKTTYRDAPWKFEAGTPDIAAVIGLGAAIDFIERVGIDAIRAHEEDLIDYALGRLAEVPGLRFIGEARERAGVIGFVLDGIHAHDVGTVLDREGIAVRVGHHCAQPVMARFGLAATVRASFAVYNTRADVDALVDALGRVRGFFA
jgi:cysteine desulfurase/selenocysteine lyase